MNTSFEISIFFLQPLSHGRGEGGEPEWPPSPLRVFQALAAAAAARWNERVRLVYAAPALAWLERQAAPTIIAVTGEAARASYRLYVPDNVGDLIAKSWQRGRDASIAAYLTEKDVRPVRLRENAAEVHYLWPISDDDSEFEKHKEVLFQAARSITHVGWGIDMVAANASVVSNEKADKLPGERWYPTEAPAPTGLRTPIQGTLDDLLRKHDAFLSRIGPDGFKPVPPLTAFRVVGYRRAIDPPQPRYAAFRLLKPDASGNQAFDPVRKTRDVAGMLRNAVAALLRSQGWPEERINVFVHGKTPDGASPAQGETSPDRFQYLPLPTINSGLDRVDAIRRVLLIAPPHCLEEIAQARRILSGELLAHDGEPKALLTILPHSDWVLRQYVAPSENWSTVTPVILNGYDDRDSNKARKLLKTAFLQAGFKKELVDRIELEWRGVGYRAGVDLASRYLPPRNLDGSPRYHVRVRFPQPVSGPIAVGRGRFRGFGLFASDSKTHQ